MSEEAGSTKRTRASGEVLDYLLQEFNNNHNPTPEQRKEISDKTNMTEKAVRIWFQNRRAKLRKTERMSKSNITSSIHSSRSNSVTINDYHMNPTSAYPHLDINEKYCFIDCSSLSVGSWQRIKSGYHDEQLLKESLVNLAPFTLNSVMPNVDLLVILSKKNLEINYFFSAISNNSRILFRIFYSITDIVTCSLLDNNIDKDSSEIRMSLSHQPKFSVNFFNGINNSSNQWSICDDFSEGQQVSSAHSDGGTSIPHVLVGSKDSLCFLNDFILEKNHPHNNPTSKYSLVHDAPPIEESGLSEDHNNEHFQFKDDSNYDGVWNENNELKANGLSPLGQFASETSPNSLASEHQRQNGSNTTDVTTSNSGNNVDHNMLIKEEPASFHFNEVFSANTPDFFNSSHTPNMIASLSGSLQQDNLTATEVLGTANESPHYPVPLSENYEMAPPDQTFDFPVVNEYSGAENSGNEHMSSPTVHQVDTFIDYNSNYP